MSFQYVFFWIFTTFIGLMSLTAIVGLFVWDRYLSKDVTVDFKEEKE